MIVKMNDLQKVFNILLQQAKRSGFSEIDLDGDWYWSVSYDDRENFNTDKPRVTIGSLYDDMQELTDVLNGEQIAMTVDFDRLANVLKAVSAKIENSRRPFIG